MKLNDILQNIASRMNISALTPLQNEMAALSDKRCVRLIAPTGSGKTIAYTLDILKNMGDRNKGVITLIIAPSRELARQISDVVKNAAAGSYSVTVCYGGHPFIDEERSLSGSPNIVVGTPGRILDHINRGTLNPSGIRNLVIDEYDKCLELGFAGEMKRICRSLKGLQHIVVTSATHLKEWPDYLPAAIDATVESASVSENTAHEKRQTNIDISRVKCFTRDKLDSLCDLLLTLGRGRSIVFVNHRESVERVYRRLIEKGFAATMLHGALDQPERENSLEMLANGSATVMVSTDLAARGLDIADVDNVIHYHMPPTSESWTHRNGRTARMCASGNIYIITTDEENIPEYVVYNRDYIPNPEGLEPVKAAYRTLYLNLGRREKISRGDIVGYLLANTMLGKDDIGRISLRDHCSLVAVTASKAYDTVRECASAKIKNKRVKISVLKS